MNLYNRMVLPYHYAQAVYAGMKFQFPAKKMTVIGVTGTNGKTTTCFMIWKMLNKSGRKAGILTTVGWGVDKIEAERDHMTTVDAVTLNRRIQKIAESGADFLVLEVTSHALSQFRISGIPVDIGVFTNLTHEHLDYHGTMDEYRKAKGKLFEKAKISILNADDQNSQEYEKISGKYITYGIKNGENRAEKIKMNVGGVEYSCGDIKVETKMPGIFNVYNSLAAVCVGKQIGLSNQEIHDGILALDEVEGRMNVIDEGQNFTVIVDYAHAPDAIEKVFDSLESCRGRIIAVHGGAGRRDPSTRSIRGEILGRYADVVIITEDDSRDEDPQKIADEFLRGAQKVGKKLNRDLFLELDRREAIKKALKMAKKNDVVLILGKGHEKTILRADGAHDFEDIKVVKQELKKLKG